MFCANLLSCYTLTLDFALLPLWFQGLVARGLGDLPRKWDGWNFLHNHGWRVGRKETVQMLRVFLRGSGWPAAWKLNNSELALWPLKNLLGHEPMHLLREGTTGLNGFSDNGCSCSFHLTFAKSASKKRHYEHTPVFWRTQSNKTNAKNKKNHKHKKQKEHSKT